MLFYLVVKYLCWLWSVVPDDAAITLFCIISFFETVFEVWLFGCYDWCLYTNVTRGTPKNTERTV